MKPILRHVVHFNDVNYRRTMPVVKGSRGRDPPPEVTKIVLLKSGEIIVQQRNRIVMNPQTPLNVTLLLQTSSQRNCASGWYGECRVFPLAALHPRLFDAGSMYYFVITVQTWMPWRHRVIASYVRAQLGGEYKTIFCTLPFWLWVILKTIRWKPIRAYYWWHDLNITPHNL